MRRREGKEEHAGDAGRRSLAEFLARASVRDRYPHYDLGAAEARLLRTTRARGAAAPARRRAYGWSDPARECPLDSERARRDLKAACLAVVCAPRAEAQLAAFIASAHTDLAGAVVFGCLLHLAGLREGARFWWQFAAGSGRARTAPAAYCLFLDHSRRGEHHDAKVWARELGRRGFRPSGRRDLREVRLCAQAAVLRYLDQLDDPDLGPVPLPRPGLPSVLTAFRPPLPPPAQSAGRAVLGSGAYAAAGMYAAAGAVGSRRRGPRPGAARPGAARPGAARPVGAGSGGADGLGPGPLRHPALASAARRGGRGGGGEGEALAEARRALAVVRVLEKHPLGVRAGQLARESALAEAELRPLLAMLCEEEYAYRPGAGVYARGPALDRLAAPGGAGLPRQLQRTLALARDSAGAAVYLSRYADGEVRITQMADGPGTPPVQEWVDFKAAAHASAVGKCLLTQLDHDGRRDHLARHHTARLTPQTITDSRALFSALDALAPGAPVFDLREYSPGVVCSAVPIATGEAAGSLALSLPATHAHRLHEATEALRRKAVPVLLALLLSGAIPPDAPAPAAGAADGAGAGPDAPEGSAAGDGAPEPAPAAGQPVPTRVTAETLRHLRSLFRTPLARATASASGPHLVSDTAAEAAYFFDAPADGGPPRLALPHTFAPLTPGSLRAREGLVVLGT
ncbi:IclR family transcriptional regulator C-terminal domain-containing protein [Streptomyces sp. NPDC046876]|uniref:IclR family transcriptional regulator domain-containing protein n=1 Tax=Streptomyces sp. NPDC046876 TaxID=3155616 RepID=UPI0033F397D7